MEQVAHDFVEPSAQIDLPRRPTALKLTLEQQKKVLGSIPPSTPEPERAELLHSNSRPAGYFYARLPPKGDVHISRTCARTAKAKELESAKSEPEKRSLPA